MTDVSKNKDSFPPPGCREGKKRVNFMELEEALPHSENPATDSCSGFLQCSSHPYNLFIKALYILT
jgi:hypothetical protein